MLKKALFSPAQPWRLLHPPALSLPRQPLRPGTRLLPSVVLSRPSSCDVPPVRELSWQFGVGRVEKYASVAVPCGLASGTTRLGATGASCASSSHRAVGALLQDRQTLTALRRRQQSFPLFEMPVSRNVAYVLIAERAILLLVGYNLPQVLARVNLFRPASLFFQTEQF